MRFKKLDLNLLVALTMLLRTRSVSESARQLNLSQPAMSSALSRLRDFFKDDLLVSVGRQMKPTAYGEMLMPLVARVIEGVEDVVATSAIFNPATSNRSFRIGASDYIAQVLLVPLIRELATEAPNVRIEMEPSTENTIRRLDEGIIDLVLMPDQFHSSAHPSELLFEEEHVVVGCSSNPVFKQPLTEEAFFAHDHVVVEIGRERAAPFGERQLANARQERRIVAIAPSFTMVPWLLSGTNRLAVMHRRLAENMCPLLSLQWVPMPFPFPLMREMVQTHRVRRNDAGIVWLIGRLVEAASLGGSPSESRSS